MAGNLTNRITTHCPTCLNGFTVDAKLIGRDVQCTACQAHFRVTQSNPPAIPVPGNRMPVASKQPAQSGWEEKVYQWGLGLIAIGLIGLILPAFGLELRRLRALGEMQWVVLIVIVTVGCGAVLLSRRNQLKLGIMITGGALSTMLLFAYFSFWRHAIDASVTHRDASVVQEGPRIPKNGGTPTETKSPLIAGRERGDRYSDSAPAGGLLVGLRCSKGKNWGGALQAVQPIYQVGTGYVLGQRHGTPGGDEQQLLAKPGYAVGKIQARAGLVLNAVQLVFYRTKGQRLDPSDHYESLWVGSDGGDPFDLDVHGAPITEVFGTWKDDIVSIGIKPTENLTAPIPLASAAPPDLLSPADPTVEPSSAIGLTTPATPPTAGRPQSQDSRTAANEPTPMLAGRSDGKPFEDESPPGGVLVGLRCSKGKNWGGALQAVQPIYQVGTGYVVGQRHGAPGGDEEQLLAKPGYAVGAIHARAGAILNAVQIVFYRIKDQRLDFNDHYQTLWIGCDGGRLFDMDGKGSPITGLFGTWHEDIVSLGLKPDENLSSPIPLASEPPPDIGREPRPGTVLGSLTGTAVMDSAPDGGVLVGVRAFCDPAPHPTLRSLKPIYIHGDRYVEGRQLGEGGTDETLAVARPGFVVSGIGLTIAFDVCGLRLKFKKLTPGDGGAADQEYESQWLGCTFPQSAQEMSTGDRVAVGLISYCDTHPRGIGLMLSGSQSANLTAQPELPKEYQTAAFARSPMRAGGESGKPFRDVAPEGGLLVGLRCAQGKNWGGALQAVQPIYQVGTGHVLGRRHGTAGGNEQQLLAKPGYAVGAIHARAGLVLNAVQLSFYRINGLRLDPSDHYESPWIGSDGGGSFDLDPKGDPITGIFGTWVEDLISLGCSPTASMLESIPFADGSPPKRGTAKAELREHRQWTSADGKATIEGKMIGIGKDSVRIERRDGKVITVPIARLSAPDVEYVQSQQ